MLSARIYFFAFTLLFAFTQAHPWAEPNAEAVPVAVVEALPVPEDVADPDTLVDLFPDPPEAEIGRGSVDDDEIEEPDQAFAALVRRAAKCDINCITDKLLYKTTIKNFISEYRNKKYKKSELIWDSNGCSVPNAVAKALRIDGNKPFGYNFLNSCYRHDFGYRNYKKQKRFSENNREKVDNNLMGDMYNVCKQYSGRKVDLCRRVADAYYIMVRLCGSGETCTNAILIISLLRKIIFPCGIAL